MKVGIVGVGRVGTACALSLVARGSAREVVIVDRTRARAKAVVADLRYGAPLCPTVALRDGDYIAEAVLRDERAVLPIGAYNADYGVTLSLPSVVGREGVSRILQPTMSDEERRSLAQSAEVLRQALQRITS
jgi:malate/lactate dehydrogenase